ncbi:MAG: hypothetical protein ACRD6B_02240, partial [Bryobacteraceae bacterium]
MAVINAVVALLNTRAAASHKLLITPSEEKHACFYQDVFRTLQGKIAGIHLDFVSSSKVSIVEANANLPAEPRQHCAVIAITVVQLLDADHRFVMEIPALPLGQVAVLNAPVYRQLAHQLPLGENLWVCAMRDLSWSQLDWMECHRQTEKAIAVESGEIVMGTVVNVRGLAISGLAEDADIEFKHPEVGRIGAKRLVSEYLGKYFTEDLLNTGGVVELWVGVFDKTNRCIGFELDIEDGEDDSAFDATMRTHFFKALREKYPVFPPLPMSVVDLTRFRLVGDYVDPSTWAVVYLSNVVKDWRTLARFLIILNGRAHIVDSGDSAEPGGRLLVSEEGPATLDSVSVTEMSPHVTLPTLKWAEVSWSKLAAEQQIELHARWVVRARAHLPAHYKNTFFSIENLKMPPVHQVSQLGKMSSSQQPPSSVSHVRMGALALWLRLHCWEPLPELGSALLNEHYLKVLVCAAGHQEPAIRFIRQSAANSIHVHALVVPTGKGNQTVCDFLRGRRVRPRILFLEACQGDVRAEAVRLLSQQEWSLATCKVILLVSSQDCLVPPSTDWLEKELQQTTDALRSIRPPHTEHGSIEVLGVYLFDDLAQSTEVTNNTSESPGKESNVNDDSGFFDGTTTSLFEYIPPLQATLSQDMKYEIGLRWLMRSQRQDPPAWELVGSVLVRTSQVSYISDHVTKVLTSLRRTKRELRVLNIYKALAGCGTSAL